MEPSDTPPNMILDTNIPIAYLAGEESVIRQIIEWREQGVTLYLPSVAETEVLSFSKWNAGERSWAEKFLAENFLSIPFDRTLARYAGKIRAENRLKFPDAAIAAVALHSNLPLVTRNVRDFRKITNLTIVTI